MTTGPPQIKRIAIIGAGNGGCAAAAQLSHAGFEVRLWGRSPTTTAPLAAIGGVHYEGAIGDGFAPIALITNTAGEAIAGADLVLIMAPTHAHGDVARTIAPHLREQQLVMAAPGHTLLLIPQSIRAHGGRLGTYCDSSSLPFICRKSAPDKIRVTRVAQILYFAAFPGELIDEVAASIRQVLPQIVPQPSLLHTVFPYTNAIHHPPALLLNVGRVESTGGDYHHYYDGITPSVGRLIDALDRERIAVAAALGVNIEPLPQFFFRMGYTNAAGRDGTAYDVFHNSEPNRFIRAPASIDHRFLNEDVPYGLVAIAELGRIAGVLTPVADAVIDIAAIVADRPFRTEGLTAERMGIAGLSASALAALLATGRYPQPHD
ncbi:MAG: NAD/NADP octopine/nopaline dehydrogenase family protein [Hyphomicrobiales bacterium]|nr:NAD/NADP octopine/nopaline dehydrogenase family protein [Hyphomicrobiales bacterium]